MKTIGELWTSRDQTEWLNAVKSYYSNKSVRMNLELEMRMSKLNAETVRGFSDREWYNFLKDEYFPWKFKGNWLPKRIENLEKYDNANGLSCLLSIKKRLFGCALTKLSGIRKALEIAEEINGLGPAGASGLLALLFPQCVGTADSMVVKALRQIDVLPEKDKAVAMMNGKDKGSLTDSDAMLLIDIMRRKATELNRLFGTDAWTPRRIDMILWDFGNNHGAKGGCC